MSLTVDGVWKAGVWATTVWAEGVWRASAGNPGHFFGGEFFGGDFFGTLVGGGTSKHRKKPRVIRFSDLDLRERQEALLAIPVRPFTPLEQAAADLALADEEDIEDDEIILLAMMKILL